MTARISLVLTALFAAAVLAVSLALVFRADEARTVSTLDDAEIARLHARLVVIDTHVDITPQWATEKLDPLADGRWQVDVPKMRAGGVDAVFFIVYVGQGPRTVAGQADATAKAFAKFAAIRRMTDNAESDEIALATSAGEVEALVAEGRVAALIGIENGYSVGTMPALLPLYAELGARYLGLTHNGHNALGDSAIALDALGDAETEHGGLSPYGAQLIEDANRLGIMVDVSHAAKTTALGAIEASRAPVIASHSAVAALRAHPRNLDDETLDAIAARGGVVQIVAFDDYLHEVAPEKADARRDLYARYGLGGDKSIVDLDAKTYGEFVAALAALDATWPRASVIDLVDHIAYAVNRIGIDHVGIASDFGGGGGVVGWSNAAETPNVTRELVKRGFDEAALTKLWGGNLLRVMRAVEAVAATEPGEPTE